MPVYRRQNGLIVETQFRDFLNATKSVLQEVSNLFSLNSVTVDQLETLVARLNDICCTSSLIVGSSNERLYTVEFINLLAEFLDYAQQIKLSLDRKCEALKASNGNNLENTGYICPMDQNNGRGRPRYAIEQSQLEFLRGKHFTWAQIARLLNISTRTLRRRRDELGIVDEPFTDISDEHLRIVMEMVRNVTPNIGQTRMMGALRSRGIRVQRCRVRHMLRIIDPLGTILRWNQAIYRRKYSVPRPNSLWHIDGNHKMIGWRIVIHACIDGYSRLVVYLHCANNNLAETVEEQFLQGIQRHGLPSRVRCDHGLENVDVARYMLHHRGATRGSILTGNDQYIMFVLRDCTEMYTKGFCHTMLNYLLTWKVKVCWILWMKNTYFVSILSIFLDCKRHLMNLCLNGTLILLALKQTSALSNYLLQGVLQTLLWMIHFQMTLTCLAVGQTVTLMLLLN